jgi:hypothetical protein
VETDETASPNFLTVKPVSVKFKRKIKPRIKAQGSQSNWKWPEILLLNGRKNAPKIKHTQ